MGERKLKDSFDIRKPLVHILPMNKTNGTKMKTETSFRDAKFEALFAATPDARGFFESVLGFSGFADQYIRVSAQDQRRYFGRAPFGKCAIKVSDVGVVKLIKTKAFGHDMDSIEFYYDNCNNCFRSTWDNAEIVTPANI